MDKTPLSFLWEASDCSFRLWKYKLAIKGKGSNGQMTICHSSQSLQGG